MSQYNCSCLSHSFHGTVFRYYRTKSTYLLHFRSQPNNVYTTSLFPDNNSQNGLNSLVRCVDTASGDVGVLGSLTLRTHNTLKNSVEKLQNNNSVNHFGNILYDTSYNNINNQLDATITVY